MHKDPITFNPSHTLIMCTNHLPIVSGDDPAVWRRILTVPFDVVIPEDQRDGKLPERLRQPDVQANILTWCLEGYQEYAQIGLAPPEAVKARTNTYRSESDIIGRFLGEKVDFGESCRVTSAELYRAYETWVRAEGEEAVTKTEFGKEMGRRHYTSVKAGGQMIYRGLMVVKDDDE
jgi:putative DNA primase/helicase